MHPQYWTTPQYKVTNCYISSTVVVLHLNVHCLERNCDVTVKTRWFAKPPSGTRLHAKGLESVFQPQTMPFKNRKPHKDTKTITQEVSKWNRTFRRNYPSQFPNYYVNNSFCSDTQPFSHKPPRGRDLVTHLTMPIAQLHCDVTTVKAQPQSRDSASGCCWEFDINWCVEEWIWKSSGPGLVVGILLLFWTRIRIGLISAKHRTNIIAVLKCCL